MLTRCGFTCKMPGGTYFLYTKVPQSIFQARAVQYLQWISKTPKPASQFLINEHSICTVPWDDAGPFLRFSVTYEAPNEKDEDALMAETESRLQKLKPVF